MLATVAYSTIAWFQLRAMRGQLASMEGSRLQTDKQLQQSAENFAFQMRPWVGVTGDFTGENVTGSVSTPHILRLAFSLENSGASPASTIIPRFSYIKYNPFANPDTGHAIDDLCHRIEREELPRNDGYFLLPGAQLPAVYQLGTIEDWKGSYDIIGCVVYKDTRGIVHHTRMCRSLFLPSGTSKASLSNCGFQSAD